MNTNVISLRPIYLPLIYDGDLPLMDLVHALADAGFALSNTKDGLLIHLAPEPKVQP